MFGIVHSTRRELESRQQTATRGTAVRELGQEVNRLHHEVWPQIFAVPSEPQRDGELWIHEIEGDGSATFIVERAKPSIG